MNSSTHPPPRTDDHTSEVIDDAVSALAERRRLWLGSDATVIHVLASLIAQAECELPLAVTTARDEGCSWDDIAQLLGTSASTPTRPRRGWEVALRRRLTHGQPTEHTPAPRAADNSISEPL